MLGQNLILKLWNFIITIYYRLKTLFYATWQRFYKRNQEHIPLPEKSLIPCTLNTVKEKKKNFSIIRNFQIDPTLDDIRYQLNDDEKLIVNIFRKLDDKRKKRLIRDIHKMILAQEDENDEF